MILLDGTKGADCDANLYFNDPHYFPLDRVAVLFILF